MKLPKKKAVPGDLDCGRYHKREDAVMRLDDSVFLYGTVPVYGKLDVEDPKKIKLTAVNSNKTLKVADYNDELINFDNLDPGFFESGTTLYYVSRVPARKQKQGVSTSNIQGKAYKADTGNFVGVNIPWSCLLNSSFAGALTGSYRPAKESFLIHKNTSSPVAVSNRLALCNGNVYFDLNNIGTVDKEKDTPYIKLKDTYMDSILVMHLSSLGVETDG